MTAPTWMNAVVSDFGRAAGANGFGLGPSGSAALKFANGSALRFEYTGDELVIAMTFRPALQISVVRRLLSLANPRASSGVRIRSGIMPKTGAAVVAVRLPERDVTLPTVNSMFALLWRAAEEIGGVS